VPTTVQANPSAKVDLSRLLKTNPEARVCVIRSLGGIGDVLMTLPAVETIKHRYPDCHITYACDRHSGGGDIYYQLIKNVPFIDEIIDARHVDRSRYDGVVDITSVCIRHENSSSVRLNRIDIFTRACGFQRAFNSIPFYKVELVEKLFAATVVQPLHGKKLIFLHTASNDPKRCWPVRRYDELIILAKEQRPDIQFLVSDSNEVLRNKEQYENVTVVTNPDIRKLAAVIDACDVFVGPDSGPMHIAGALDKRSLCLFGSIPGTARINYYSNSVAIESVPRLSCQYCWYAKCGINYKCMSNITAKQVYDALIRILGKSWAIYI
jgi:ADP-heptose:LPS heptosyltransferase